MSKYKVFVYGTLKRGFRLHNALATSKFIGEYKLRNYRLYTVEGAWFPAISGIDANPDDYVVGEVYEVDGDTLRTLDRIEGEGHLYNRVEEDGIFTYVWARGLDRLLPYNGAEFKEAV